MGRRSGISQLFKGIIIGIVLILAIIGIMSLINNEDENTAPDKTPWSQQDRIQAPTISINKPLNHSLTQTQNTIEANLKTVDSADKKKTEDKTFKPKLDDEPGTPTSANPTPAEDDNQDITGSPEVTEYGRLNISIINTKTGQQLNADFTVYDKDNNQVANTKSSSNSSLRLPAGQYRIDVVLNNTNATSRPSKPVKYQKTIYLPPNKTIAHVFKMTPPSTIGVLQVSAISASNTQPVKASFFVHNANNELIANRQNVMRSIFKLTAGRYKVIAKNGQNKDIRTVIVEPDESTKEVFKLKEASNQGTLQLRIVETSSSQPVPADILITKQNGETVQSLKSVTQTEISLPVGDYNIQVTTPKQTAKRSVSILSGKTIYERFKLNNEASDTTQGVQITDNVRITVPQTETEDETPKEAASIDSKGELATISLLAINAVDQKPIKSNFYIQLPNGKHVARKIYADTAQFTLKPGLYRITVRAKNRSNIVRTLELRPGDKITENFILQRNIQTAQTSNQSPTTPVLAPSKPPKNGVIPSGFLNVNMEPPGKTHFIVATRRGKRIAELTSVPSARFKLDTGNYIVTAIQNRIRHNKPVRVLKNRTTQVTFNARDFQRANTTNNKLSTGILRSRIIDQSGRPLRGDLTVANRRGQVVARSNGVSEGVFDLLPGSYTVIVNYQGLRGSEQITIKPKESTIQTFTIAPDRAPPPPQNTNIKKREKQRGFKDILRDKLEEEIRRQF